MDERDSPVGGHYAEISTKCVKMLTITYFHFLPYLINEKNNIVKIAKKAIKILSHSFLVNIITCWVMQKK